MTQLKRLSSGFSDFQNIIADKCIYVDKTEYIYRLIQRGSYYFVARPRRFGKSLLVSTLKAIFQGKKELFDGCFIASTDFEWLHYPILYLSFSGIRLKKPDDLEEDIMEQLLDIGLQYDIDVSKKKTMRLRLLSLVRQMARKNRIVVLIDERDASVLNHPEMEDECLAILKSFFAVFKDLDEHLRFVFITGVTNYIKSTIFSGMNNLTDITLNESASVLFGYTIEEIKQYFHEYIEDISHKLGISKEGVISEMQFWYNGHVFSNNTSVKVFNPYSVQRYLEAREFHNYWFSTGTPNFLMELVKDWQEPIYEVDGSIVNIEQTNVDNFTSLKLIPTLWRTGYLTIESYDVASKNYTLTYPNEEVKTSFLTHILHNFYSVPFTEAKDYAKDLASALVADDLDSFFKDLNAFMVSIPYTAQLPSEKYYQSLFYLILNILGIPVDVEVPTNDGRIDAVMRTASTIYIFEFKMHKDAEEALQQILDKKYYRNYLNKGKKVTLIGVSFNINDKAISNWVIKRI